MSTTLSGSLNDYLRQVLRSWRHDNRTDIELLTAFCQHREEQAFNMLVVRHGMMVWRICRRTLRLQQDAEDAFQATFLVLAKKAALISSRERVGHWLASVARRTACGLRKSVLRHGRYEQQVQDMASRASSDEEANDDLLTELYEQIDHLPRQYREVLQLCRLECKTYAEAAQELNSSVMTICRRVHVAEQLLRERLSRRGLALSAGGLAAVLSQVTAVSALPARLTSETVRAALAFVGNTLGPTRAVLLAQGVLQMMGHNKAMLLCSVTVTALLCLGGAGLGLLAQPLPPAQARGTEAAPAEAQAPAPPGGQRLDRHGDPLPEGALARIGTLRFQPDKWGDLFANDGAFLPDGKTLASVHGTDTVHFWDVATGKERRRLRAQEIKNIHRVRVSPDGRLLAAAGGNEVEVWDLTAEAPRLLWKHQAQGRVFFLAIAPDGGALAFSDIVFMGDKPSLKIHLLDARSGKQRQSWDGVACSFPKGLEFSPDGKLLAEWEVGEETIVCVWEVATKKKLLYLNNPWQFFAGFGPDSRTLATRDEKGLTVWDIATGKEKRRIARAAPLGGPFLLLFELATFLPDGTLLQVDQTHARFWDPVTGKQRRPQFEATGLAFNLNEPFSLLSPDGKLLASINNNVIRVWGVDTGKAVGPEGVAGGVKEVAFSPAGDSLATLNDMAFLTGEANVQLWQASTGVRGPRLKFKPRMKMPHAITSQGGLHYAPDQRVYARQWSVLGFESRRSDLAGWDARSGKAVDLPPGVWQAGENPFGVQGWAVSPDGRLLARLREGEDITLYELATGREFRRLKGLADIKHLVFSADGRSLAGYGGRVFDEHALAVWDVPSGHLRLLPLRIKHLGDHFRYLMSLSSDGRWLAAYVEEKEEGQEGQPVTKVVQVWEVASGKAALRRPTGPETVCSLAWSPDGRMLATGYQNGTIQLWEAGSGQKRHSLRGHRGAVTALAFSADGARLASGSADTTALVWDMRRLPAPAAAAADRPMTEKLLHALTRDNAAAAYRAICQLVETPGTSIAELRKRLQPPAPPDPQQVRRWLEDLDSKDFKTREHAFAELANKADSVEAALHRALDGQPTLEKRRRLEKLLELLHPSRNPARLFVLRGVEALERIGTPQARKALEELAQLQGYLVSHEAQAALLRLAKPQPNVKMP